MPLLELAEGGLRVEEADVEDYWMLLPELVDEGEVAGIRVEEVDFLVRSSDSTIYTLSESRFLTFFLNVADAIAGARGRGRGPPGGDSGRGGLLVSFAVLCHYFIR